MPKLSDIIMKKDLCGRLSIDIVVEEEEKGAAQGNKVSLS